MYTYEDSVKLSLAELAAKKNIANEPKRINQRIRAGLRNLVLAMRLQKVNESFELHAAMADEAKNFVPYCLKCGSCGDTICCPPTKCATVQCRYPEANFGDYQVQLASYDALYNELVLQIGEDAVGNILTKVEDKYLQGK